MPSSFDIQLVLPKNPHYHTSKYFNLKRLVTIIMPVTSFKKILFSIVLAFMLLSPTSLKAAGPVTHLYFADFWLKTQNIDLDETEKKLFFAGTLFPDIRYLGVIRRSETHPKKVNLAHLKDFCKKDPFSCGMYLHAYIDMERAKFVKSYKISRHLRTIPHTLRDKFLKFFEDELLAETTNTNNTLISLNHVYKEELSHGVQEHDVKRWHRYLQVYLAQKPILSLETAALVKKKLFNLDAAMINKITQLMASKKEQPAFQKYVEALRASLEKKLSSK